ncbi:MAG: Carboxylesterase NlhH [Pseudomonadota bacterium]|jgi:acetyl esterase/lipase
MPHNTPTLPLDPAIVEIDRRWKAAGIPDLYEGGNGPVSRERARNVRALLYPKPKLPEGRIESRTIPGPAGNMAVRVIYPLSGEITGTLVYLHGGGWVVGDLESHEAHAIRLANRAGVVVLNVDYRLAPEHPFPAAADDAEAALQWASTHLDELGGNDKPLAVGGDSAGGNLAAVAALYCRDHGIALACQLLLYPATNLSGRGGPEKSYLGDNAEAKALDPRVSPLKASTLAGLAPAIIGVGVHDFLYQDNLAYAAALKGAGVPLLMRVHGDLNHGFFSYTAVSPASAVAADQLCDDLRQHMLA